MNNNFSFIFKQHIDYSASLKMLYIQIIFEYNIKRTVYFYDALSGPLITKERYVL
jgi:hypothetical protein